MTVRGSPVALSAINEGVGLTHDPKKKLATAMLTGDVKHPVEQLVPSSEGSVTPQS